MPTPDRTEYGRCHVGSRQGSGVVSTRRLYRQVPMIRILEATNSYFNFWFTEPGLTPFHISSTLGCVEISGNSVFPWRMPESNSNVEKLTQSHLYLAPDHHFHPLFSPQVPPVVLEEDV